MPSFLPYGKAGGRQILRWQGFAVANYGCTLAALTLAPSSSCNDGVYFDVPYEIPNFDAKAIELDIKELKKYEGEFTSKQLPLKIILKIEGNQFYGQATGQSAFPLIPFSKAEFRFEQAGIVIEFVKASSGKIQYDSFVLRQGGGKFTYEKQ